MNDLIKIAFLTKEEIKSITESAASFKAGRRANHSMRHVALMFFENSTRTRFSFECALNRLGAHSYLFDSLKSSSSKGEEVFDTINNLAAIGINTFIVRTGEENLLEELKKQSFYKPVFFVNAGDGKSAHPTQALLDYFTIYEKLGRVEGKKVVIIGDIKHSRVAKSNIALLNKFNAKVVTCAPAYFKEEIEGADFVEDLNTALLGADIVMCLRIQNERLKEAVSREDFIARYRINFKNFPEDAILMHPGPVNRDVEIESKLLDTPAGQTILEQAENGVYVRMAVLDKIFKESGR